MNWFILCLDKLHKFGPMWFIAYFYPCYFSQYGGKKVGNVQYEYVTLFDSGKGYFRGTHTQWKKHFK